MRERIAERERKKVSYGPVADVGLGAVRGFAGTLGSGAAGLASLVGAEDTARSIREATDIRRPFGYAAPGGTAADIGEMLGGAGAFLGGTGLAAAGAATVGAPAAVGALLSGALLGAGTGVEEQRQRREQAELEGRPISENAELLSALGGAAIGATEALPFGRLAKQTLAPLARVLGPASKTGLEAAEQLTKRGLAKSVGIQAAEEAGQEAFSQVAQSALEKQLYSPDRDVFAGVGEAAVAGGGIGALLELGLRGPGRVAARRRYQDALASGATEPQAVAAAQEAIAEQPAEIQDEESILTELLAEERPTINELTKPPEVAPTVAPEPQVAPVEAAPEVAQPEPAIEPEPVQEAPLAPPPPVEPPESAKPGEPPPVEAPVEAVPDPAPPPLRRNLADAWWDENPHVTPDDLNHLVEVVQGGVPVRKAIDQVFGDRALDARPVLERQLGFIQRGVGPKSTFELAFDPNDYNVPQRERVAPPQEEVPEIPQVAPEVPAAPPVPPAEGDWRSKTLGELRGSLGKMKLDQRVGVELADSVLTRLGQAAEGEYNPDTKAIRLSLDMANRSLSERQQHLAQVLDHEVVHVARPLFTPQEWGVLSREAKKRGHLATAEELYKEQPDYSPELATEESVANLFRDRAEGAALPSTMTGLYNRFVDYMTRFGNSLRGQGFQTADDVFAKLRSGEVGGRQETAPAEGGPRYALKRPEPPPTESQRAIDAAKLIRAGQPVDPKAFSHPADLDYAQRLAKNTGIDLDEMRKIDPDSLFNISKLDLNDRTKEHLRNEVRLLAMTEGFDPKKRVGFDQVRREANAMLGQHVPLDVKKLKSGETLHPSVRLAMAKLVRQSQAEIVRATDALTKGAADGSLTNDQQLAEQHRLDIVRAERDRLLTTLIPARTQDGRNLVMHRIEVQSSFDPVYWNAVMKRKLNLPPHVNVPPEIMEPLNTALGKGQAAKDAFDAAAAEEAEAKTPEAAKKRAKAEKDLVDAKKAVAAEAQKFERTKPLEALLSLWKAGLLTGVPTQIANFTSNASFSLLEKLASMPAAWIDTALSYTKLGDGRRTVLNQLSPGAWDRAWVGAIRGGKEGVKQFQSAVTGGSVEGGQAALGRIDVPRSFNLGGGNMVVRGVENYVNGVFGAQMAADRPFFRSAEATAAREVAQLAAKNDPKTFPDPEALEQRMARQRELGNKDPELETLNTEVKAMAEFATFANENFGSRGFQSLKRGMQQSGAAGKAAAFIAEGVVPFVKVPTNVFKAIIEYSPAGVAIGSARLAADAIVKKSLDARSQRLYSQLIGRGLIGSALMFLGYKAAEAGLMTGFRDDQDTGGRTADAAAGHPQGALYVGNGKWAQVGRISPGGNLLVIGASLYREGNRPLRDISKQTGNLYAAATQSVMEMPFMMGAENLIEAVKNPGTQGAQYLTRQAGTVVPAAVARLAAATDPLQRETKGQGPLAGVKARLPGLRQTLPARHDVLARPLLEAGIGPVGRFADPFRTTEERQDPVSQEILRTQFSIGVPQVKKDEERPTYLLRSQLAGELYRQKLAAIIQTPEYQEGSDEVKRELLKDAKEEGGRNLSKLTVYNPEYKEATEADRRMQLERYLRDARSAAQ
ncbi:MAG: hypothetical protein ABWY12_09695 [Burkholderiales bacterium]